MKQKQNFEIVNMVNARLFIIQFNLKNRILFLGELPSYHGLGKQIISRFS